MTYDFEQLRALLRQPAAAPEVVAITQKSPEKIERYEHTGFVDLPPQGLSVIFKQAPWVVALSPGQDRTQLIVCAVHFHGEGHENHVAYRGCLPGQIDFGDSETEVVAKLGNPQKTGGGGFSTMLKKPIPRWLRYMLGEDIFQLQLTADGRVEMETLYVQDRQQPI